MLNGVFLTILETKIFVYALPNCWWFMCMHSIYKIHFILFYLGGKGGDIWMVVKGPKRDSILLYGAKIWEESAKKIQMGIQRGPKNACKKGHPMNAICMHFAHWMPPI
jgi:hypothetical protein